MTPEQHELWTRIEAFELDVPGAALPFSARLARENGWSADFTQRAIAEYKRFVFLAMCADHIVAPSEEVDQVWHFHLTYTRSYWDELCGQILPRPLHHGPTRGGKEEGAKFHDLYERTLESYRRFFGAEPPSDLWPAARVRFGKAQWVRVDAQRSWIIGKPQWILRSSHPHPSPPPQAGEGATSAQPVACGIRSSLSRLRGRAGVGAGSVNTHTSHYIRRLERAASTCSTAQPPPSASKTRWGLALVALLLLMAGCDQVGQAVPVFDWGGAQFLMFYTLFTPAVLLGAYVWRSSWRAPGGDVGDHELPRDPYAVALLNGGAAMALQAAVVELARRRAVEISASGTISPGPNFHSSSAPTHPLEAAILGSLSTTIGYGLIALRQFSGVKNALQGLENYLYTTGFAVPKSQALQARNATLGLAMLPVLVGIMKIAIGISRDKPVGFLVVLTVFAFIAALCIFWKAPFRSARGDKALLRLRLRHTNLKTQHAHRDLTTSADTNILPLAVGLYGLAVLDQTPLADLHLRQRLRGSSGSGSSSDSGGGGDSGGGDSGCGGGGCGGCGGGD